ncbi:retinoic acid-induced protein 2 [Denticeps clupeoides]|uniref:Retinoic acid induced 2 n=1 Tax=Denticeps clupeoides TaxID=299321 RepID=A0AAY4CB29_9TELE|nr:retinoic acid-induced protein 2 [Denticeps clupeoides]XP_028818935.1 retinoic acid-induced protein 2 [Denticeps clupeoides]
MEYPYKDVPVDVGGAQGDMCTSAGGEAIGKLEDDGNSQLPSEAWNVDSSTLTKRSLSPVMGVPSAPVVTQATESPGGVALKLATTVLQPICLGENPVVLPILAGPGAPQVGQAATAPYLVTSQCPVSLPLVLEQQVFQHLTPQVVQQANPCPALSLQNNILCQSAPLDQKGAAPMLDPNLLTLLQNPNFVATLQDFFPSQGNPLPACHMGGSPQADPFSSGFLPPPLFPHPYSSPLAPLVPPATLLVPYPVIVPLPVPLPIPIPIPIPVPNSEDSKLATDPPKPACTLSKGTQTRTKDFMANVPSPSAETMSVPGPSQDPFLSVHPLPEGEVLDLSIRAPPIQTKQEVVYQQDNVLDLSLPGVRKTCIQSCSSHSSTSSERDREDLGGGALTLGVLRPVECSPKLDAKLLSSLASLEFSQQHKWLVDSSGGVGGPGRDAALGGSGNIEIVSTSQTAKVIVSVKDAMPAIFCGKLKGISGVSTKNFSIKHDAGHGGYASLPRVPGDQRGDPNDTKKMPKSRAIKLKKVSSQEIHILPIKKQRLTAFLPRK